MRYIAVFLILSCLCGCKDVKLPERAAVVAGKDFTFCGGCGGWIVYVIEETDTTRYRADVASPFDKPGTPVYIRFERDESDGLRIQGRWIKLKSIRSR